MNQLAGHTHTVKKEEGFFRARLDHVPRKDLASECIDENGTYPDEHGGVILPTRPIH